MLIIIHFKQPHSEEEEAIFTKIVLWIEQRHENLTNIVLIKQINNIFLYEILKLSRILISIGNLLKNLKHI